MPENKHTLQSRQDRLIRAQDDLEREILAYSSKPQHVRFLLHQLRVTATELEKTTVSLEIAHKQRKPWYKRMSKK